MKKAFVLIPILLVALLATGCCKQIDKAKEATEVGARLSEDFAKLKDSEGNFELTPARLDKFFTHYPIFKALLEKKNEQAENLSENDNDLMALDLYVKLDKDLRDEGIDNPAEFYLTMAEVTAGFYYVTSKDFMQKAKGQLSEAVTNLKAQLNSPDMPEEQKAEIREAIAEMESSDDTAIELPSGLTEQELSLIEANLDKIATLLELETPKEETEENTDEEVL